MLRELATFTLIQFSAPTQYDRAQSYIDTREYVLAAAAGCSLMPNAEGLKAVAELRAVTNLDLSDTGPFASYIAMKRNTFKRAYKWDDSACALAMSEYGRPIRTNAYSLPALLLRK